MTNDEPRNDETVDLALTREEMIELAHLLLDFVIEPHSYSATFETRNSGTIKITMPPF